MKNLKKVFNKIAALDLTSNCDTALNNICEALADFGYCGEGTDRCSEIQRAINQYNHRWDGCVKPWAKKCGRTDTNHDLAEIPYWYGIPLVNDWWGCVRGSSLDKDKASDCSVKVLDELARTSGAFQGVMDDINTVNAICGADETFPCGFDLGGRVVPIIPKEVLEVIDMDVLPLIETKDVYENQEYLDPDLLAFNRVAKADTDDPVDFSHCKDEAEEDRETCLGGCNPVGWWGW